MLGSLRSIVQEVNAARDLSSVLDIIVRRVRDVMQTKVCSVYLLDKQSGNYVLMATQGLNQDSVGQVHMAPGEGLVGNVATREEPINLEHAEAHPAFQYFPATGEAPMTPPRSAGVIGPSCELGGRMSVRSTTPGAPFWTRKEVTASPTPTSRIASSVTKRGLSR